MNSNMNSNISTLFRYVTEFVRSVRNDVNNKINNTYDNEVLKLTKLTSNIPNDILKELERVDIDGIKIDLLELKVNTIEYIKTMKKFLFDEKKYLAQKLEEVENKMRLLNSGEFNFTREQFYLMDMYTGVIKEKVKQRYEKTGQINFDIGYDEENEKLVLQLGKEMIKFSLAMGSK